MLLGMHRKSIEAASHLQDTEDNEGDTEEQKQQQQQPSEASEMMMEHKSQQMQQDPPDPSNADETNDPNANNPIEDSKKILVDSNPENSLDSMVVRHSTASSNRNEHQSHPHQTSGEPSDHSPRTQPSSSKHSTSTNRPNHQFMRESVPPFSIAKVRILIYMF